MKSFKEKLLCFIRNDFGATSLILAVFLLTNRYIYGWDDQHLEIPLLKHLIDPTLYAGDYYVESLTKHFSSFLYPLLARLISVDMIPAAYIILYLTARFFLFFWLFKLWRHLSGSRLAAFAATTSIFLLMRTEDFIYRTFSHQEFSLAIIFAGVYFFYKDRLILAALLFGIAANFHALSALFPMLYLSVYALVFIRDRGRKFLFTALTFTAAALPFLLWHIPQALSSKELKPLLTEWLPLYISSCPQCFPFDKLSAAEVLTQPQVLLQQTYPYIFLSLLYIAHCIWNKDFRRENKNHAIFWTTALLVATCFFFSYAAPNKFILDLNLLRTLQNVIVILAGYTAIFLMKTAGSQSIPAAFLAGIAFALLGLLDSPVNASRITHFWWIFAGFIPAAAAIWYYRNSPHINTLKKLFILLPLVGMFFHYCTLHYKFVQITNSPGGFWELQRNWENMQFYVKDHTPKDAIILAPYDMEMGGFRIHSNRKVIACYRDCGLIGFDFAAAREWKKRLEDIKEFKVFANGNILPAVMKAVTQYQATHIVFMNYYAPKTDVPFLKKMHTNNIFTLYEIIR